MNSKSMSPSKSEGGEGDAPSNKGAASSRAQVKSQPGAFRQGGINEAIPSDDGNSNGLTPVQSGGGSYQYSEDENEGNGEKLIEATLIPDVQSQVIDLESPESTVLKAEPMDDLKTVVARTDCQRFWHAFIVCHVVMAILVGVALGITYFVKFVKDK